MSLRHRARECAVQLLYQWEVQKGEDVDLLFQRFWKIKPAPEEVRVFAEECVRGVISQQKTIDEAIQEVCSQWEMERLAAVDRAILRLGTYELLFREDIPPKVALDEAVRIARHYSTAQSGAFVNGVLDAIAKRHGRFPNHPTESAMVQ
ncbi:transcription antitermination factor NusB [Candidatus Methylacidithermus pantelleriae]|uniref:Transcription antitermination protein NusB n=1 Tax=Candidatus Methylacidithermus pantelleriae TaxID=2744239 RepID=A0A8J2FWA7_9BACT|nr:transcription antitermination factor NusB [Candidatus Methylacidithermus pantelleriae]CAF0698195.1 Transcription antitermination protein NusB [Candidatus Methylacidithermus pantelleriae]